MTGEPTLHYGDHSKDGWVEYAQGQLNIAQAGPIDLDGKFGDETIQAVYKFQQDQGLTVDGVIGDQTWAALRGDEAVAPHGDGHAHEQTDHGLHVVFDTAHEDIYDADGDGLYFYFNNVGDAELPQGEYYLDVNINGGTMGHKYFELLLESLPTGGLVTAYLNQIKDEIGSGEFTWRAELPSALHSSTQEGAFTIQ